MRECAFREHPAEVTEVPPEKLKVLAWHFRCECSTYIVSADLLEGYAERWKQDATGATLSRLAKRRSAQGCRLELITDQDVKLALTEQRTFEEENPSEGQD
jgi:hypothetical protein